MNTEFHRSVSTLTTTTVANASFRATMTKHDDTAPGEELVRIEKLDINGSIKDLLRFDRSKWATLRALVDKLVEDAS